MEYKNVIKCKRKQQKLMLKWFPLYPILPPNLSLSFCIVGEGISVINRSIFAFSYPSWFRFSKKKKKSASLIEAINDKCNEIKCKTKLQNKKLKCFKLKWCPFLNISYPNPPPPKPCHCQHYLFCIVGEGISGRFFLTNRSISAFSHPSRFRFSSITLAAAENKRSLSTLVQGEDKYFRASEASCGNRILLLLQ